MSTVCFYLTTSHHMTLVLCVVARAAEEGAGDGLVPGRGQPGSGVHQHPGLRADAPPHRVPGDLPQRRGERSTLIHVTLIMFGSPAIDRTAAEFLIFVSTDY